MVFSVGDRVKIKSSVFYQDDLVSYKWAKDKIHVIISSQENVEDWEEIVYKLPHIDYEFKYNDLEIVCELDNRTSVFDQQLFCGNKKVKQDIKALHARLNSAITWLSGSQQNGGMGEEFDDVMAKMSEAAIENVVQDVINALGVSNKFMKLPKL